MTQSITLALAGNPNCGKTVIFNALTGSRQRIGNWPGVTVDRKIGRYFYKEHQFNVVDLPGTYSMSMASEGAIDEKIACDYLLANEADVLVNVIDGSNLERNLYLTLQLIEVGIPVIVAVNMMDVVKQRGTAIDLKRLSQLLGCPTVALVARKNKGFEELKKNILTVAKQKQAQQRFVLPLVKLLQQALSELGQHIQTNMSLVGLENAHWLAQRLLENDYFAKQRASKVVLEQLAKLQNNIECELNEETDILIADARYRFINQVVGEVIALSRTPRQTLTQWLDRVILNRLLGLPIFFMVMYLMFVFSINIGGAFQDFFDITSTTIFVDGAAYLLNLVHAPSWLVAILADGIGKGINTVLTFIPIIGAMFLFLAFLEDSGYMARAAFVMDRFMRAIGLPGRSFVPMIVGFGCNVPAVMGARTLANRRDRVLTVMMMPFMSCGARLAIFSVFASAFFPQGGQNIIFILYVTGIAIAILTGLALRKTVLKGDSAPLVMELPPYHLPRFSSVMRHAWYRLQHFVKRAGRVIVPVCLAIGVLNAVTIDGKLNEVGGQRSLLSEVGQIVTPVLAPMGVHKNNWPATVGLVTGVLAKEVVVGTLNTLYSEQAHLHLQTEHFKFWGGLEDALFSIPHNLSDLGEAWKNPVAASEAPHEMNRTAYGLMYLQFGGKAAAFAYLLFVLLYFPCISTMAAMRREVGRGWAYFSVFWSTGVAYCLAVLCYQLLTLVDHPLSSSIWSLAMIAALGIATYAMHCYAVRNEQSMQKKALLFNGE